MAMSGRASRHLEQRFPDREIQIARWKRADPDFRDRRRDYEDCARVLDDISRSPVPDLKRVKEYREFKIALELELLPTWAAIDGKGSSAYYTMTMVAQTAIAKAQEHGISIIFAFSHNDGGSYYICIDPSKFSPLAEVKAKSDHFATTIENTKPLPGSRGCRMPGTSGWKSLESNANDKKLMQEMPVVGLVRALADRYPCGS